MPFKSSDTMMGVMMTGALGRATRWSRNSENLVGRGVTGETGRGIKQRVTVGEGTKWQPIYRTSSTTFWRPAGGSAMSSPCPCF